MYVIAEGKVDDAKKRWPDLVDSIDVAIANIDGAKYIDWIVKQLKRGEPADEVRAALQQFDSNVQRLERRDINSYKTLADVREALGKLNTSTSKEKRVAKEESEVVFQEGPLTVIEPKSEAASCLYGKGTKWCISATRTKNYYEHYKSKGARFFFIIDKSQPATSNTAKMALVMYPVKKDEIPWFELFDSHDRVMIADDVTDILGDTLEELLRIAYGSDWTPRAQTAFYALTTYDESLWFHALSKRKDANSGNYARDLFANPNIDIKIKEKAARADDDLLRDLIITGDGGAPDWLVAIAIEKQESDLISDWMYEEINIYDSQIGHLTFEAMKKYEQDSLVEFFVQDQFSRNTTPYLTEEQQTDMLKNDNLRNKIKIVALDLIKRGEDLQKRLSQTSANIDIEHAEVAKTRIMKGEILLKRLHQSARAP